MNHANAEDAFSVMDGFDNMSIDSTPETDVNFSEMESVAHSINATNPGRPPQGGRDVNFRRKVTIKRNT